ncbi:MAG: tetratricopeptide repeat protein [Chloroflexota bacterium]
MTSDSILPPPQSGRSAPPADHPEEPRGLWSQLLTAFRDLSGAFDPFANDANPQVRALGRAARERRQPHPDDYFAIGDLCARLTPQGRTLSSTYAAKAIAAYTRADSLLSPEDASARHALLAFASWTAEAARALGGYEPLKVALLSCERAAALLSDAGAASEAQQLRAVERSLRDQIDRFADEGDSTRAASERQARLLTDQGQMLLRQGEPAQALTLFEQALAADNRSHAAWLWRAMALTDLARFDEALASYDRALALEPDSAGVWNNKGSLLMELGRLEPALECFERALSLSAAVSSVKAVYWLNKGKALYMLGRYVEARDALVRSHQLDPSAESAAGIAACRDRLDMARGET